MFGRYTSKDAFKDLEKTLIRNVANSMKQLEFHMNATQEELEEYYGGCVNREALIDDTMKKLDSEQFLFKVYKNHESNLIKKHANENTIGDIDITVQRSAGTGVKQGSGDTGTKKDGGSGPKSCTHSDTGLGDDDTEGDNSDNQAEGDEGRVPDRPGEIGDVLGHDNRGAHERACPYLSL